MSTQNVHIRVRFNRPFVELNYQDERAIADRFAAVVQYFGASVTAEENLGHDLPPLPCRRRWI